MANRDLNFDPKITDVTATEPVVADTLAVVGDIGAKAAEMSAQGKALDATATTQVAFRQLDAQYRKDNISDPTNPEALSKLQSDRQQIIQNQSQDVPSIATRDYTDKAIQLGAQSDDLNRGWATKQQIRNGVNSLQTGRVTYLGQANQAGRQFAQDPDADIGSALDYHTALQSMHQFADPVLGTEKTGAFLKDFNADYVKSFVSGVAETKPELAANLLEQPSIKDHFNTQDIGDMADLIKKTTKQQQLIQSLQTTKAQTDLSDVVNDPNMTYFEKRAAVDRADMEGSVSPKAAASARRVLTSSSDVDAQTDTPAMSDVINKVYDLNADAEVKPGKYLDGIKDIQEHILELQASGDLTAQDGKKLTKQINNLTQAKLASATNSVGHEFHGANKRFDALPPEYRGQATRALFYATDGQNMTSDQMGHSADGIVDSINTQRRTEALGVVSRVANDDVFLQATGYTRADVAETAAKHGISQNDVITALRGKYGKNAKRAPKVGRASPASSEGDATLGPSPGIQLPGGPEDGQE